MTSKGVYFNGKLVTIPNIYASVDSQMSVANPSSSAKIIAMVGESTGGEPGVVQFFSNPTIAKKVLKGGTLLTAMNKAWSPVTATKQGLNLGGAYTIACIRSNPATKATSKKEAFTLESADWGVANNLIQHKVSNGDLTGTKKITIKSPEVTETFNNIGAIFSVHCTKASATTATMTIDADSSTHNAVSIELKSDSSTATIDLATIKTMQDLVNKINSYDGFSAELLDATEEGTSPSVLDTVTAVDIKTAKVIVTAILHQFKKKLTKSELVKVTLTKPGTAITNYDFEHLTGGSEGTSPISWVEYFNKLARYNIYYVVPLTSDMSIIAEGLAHVNQLSETFGRERRLICGGGNGLTVDEAVAQAQLLSDARAQYVYPGFWDVNASNQLELYPAYILAGQHAGRCAFLPDGEATTRDTYKMSGIEYELEPTQITKLLNGGVVTFEFVIADENFSNSSIKCVQDITTATTNDALYAERAVGVIADGINHEIKNKLEDILVGKKMVIAGLTTVKNIVVSILKDKVKDETIQEYKDVSVFKQGTVTYIDYSVAPSEPNNFTFVRGHFYSNPIVVRDED